MTVEERSYYTGSSRLADIIDNDPHILDIIERAGIKLGFADASAEEICTRYHISLPLFLAFCNISSFDDYHPDFCSVSSSELMTAVGFLRMSHKAYREVSLPMLHEGVHKMAALCDEKNKDLINRFFDEYDEEVNKHFRMEEELVFPYVEALAGGLPTGDYSIRKFASEHEDIEEKMEDFKNIVMKYLPEKVSSPERFFVLRHICRISEDLAIHSKVENRILVPLVCLKEAGNE